MYMNANEKKTEASRQQFLFLLFFFPRRIQLYLTDQREVLVRGLLMFTAGEPPRLLP